MKSTFEILFKLRGSGIAKQLEALNSFPDGNNTREDIRDFHLTHNLTYRDRFGDCKKQDWANIPVIEKSHFQEGLDLWISEPYQNQKRFHNKTSGSSGQPLRFTKDWECHARTWALLQKRYSEHGIDIFHDLEARFYGIPLSSKSSYYQEKVKDWIANRVRFPVFDLSDKVLQGFYQRFENKGFVYLNGYTSSLVAFARFLVRKNKSLKNVCPTLVACITTSEMCSEEDRYIMEEGFGVKVINEYGAAELDNIAFEDPDGDWLINEENLYVEIVDNDNQPIPDGEEGKILVTALYNKAMPFIRYELGDRGVISPERKNGYRKLKSLTGRTNDMALLPSGRKVPGLTFYYMTKSLLNEEGLIQEIVIKQHASNYFEVAYVASRDLTEVEKSEVRQLFDTYMEPGLILEINRVEHIHRQQSGKLKQFDKLF